GTTQTINGLSSTSLSPNDNNIQSSGGAGTLIIGDSNASGSYTGNTTDNGGQLNITKIGAGAQSLSGNNNYSGATTISGGTLTLGGNTSLNGPVSVSPSSTLQGSGNIGTLSVSNGLVSPGGSGQLTLGTFNVNGNLTIAKGQLDFDLVSPNSVGQISDRISASGNATFGDGGASEVTAIQPVGSPGAGT